MIGVTLRFVEVNVSYGVGALDVISVTLCVLSHLPSQFEVESFSIFGERQALDLITRLILLNQALMCELCILNQEVDGVFAIQGQISRS